MLEIFRLNKAYFNMKQISKSFKNNKFNYIFKLCWRISTNKIIDKQKQEKLFAIYVIEKYSQII